MVANAADRSNPSAARGNKDDSVVAVARKRFGDAMSAEADARNLYSEDVKFSLAIDQWDERVKRARGKDRPALTFNRLNGVIKQIIGDYRQNKLSIKVLPADGFASEEKAGIIAGLIRNIELQSNADIAYSTAFECALRGSFGYFRIVTQYTGDDSFDQDLLVKPVSNPLGVYFDPAARSITRADANWCFVTDSIKKDDFKRLYPKAYTGWFDSSDDWARQWCSGEHVRVAEYYEKVPYTARLVAFDNGMAVEVTDDSEIEALAQIGVRAVKEREAERVKVLWRKMTGAEVLEEREYKTKHLPVIRVSGEEVDVEGKLVCRSAISYAKDAQRNLNYWKSTATEAVALSPKAKTLLTPEQIEGLQEMWQNAHTSPMPYLLYNAEPGQNMPQPWQPAQPPVAELSMAGNSADDIKATTGIYDASLGARSNETSGRAIIARQQEGANATYLFLDNLKEAIQQAGRVLIDMIPSVYDTERVVRTLDIEGKPSTVTVNQQRHNPLLGVTEVLNDITVGKYDVLAEAGPSFANQKLEMINALQQVLPVLPMVGQAAPDLIVKALPFQGAEQIAERVRRMLPKEITEEEGAEPDPAQAQQAQMQQQQAERAMQLQEQQIAAEQAKSQATIAKAEADIIKARTGAAEALAGATASAQRPAAEPVQPAAQAPVSIQFNAEEPLNRVAATMEGFAVNQAEATGQVMEVIKGVMRANAQSTALLAESLQRQQAVEEQQAALLREIGTANAAAMQSVAAAVEQQTRVMLAPSKAVRDPKTKEIVYSVKDLTGSAGDTSRV